MNRVLPVISIYLCLVSLALAGCSNFGAQPTAVAATLPNETPNATSIVVTREVPVTVEVTREAPVAETPPPAARCAPDNVDDVEEIRIGVLIPLSSPGAARAGNAMQAAFSIAADHINGAGGVLGKNVRIVVEDTQGEPEWGAAKAQSLITDDCVAALVGVYHSRVAMSVKDVAHAFGVPLILSEPYQDDITADKYAEVFRIAPTFSMVNQSDVEWLQSVGDFNGDEQQTVLIVTESNNYGTMRAEVATELFTEHGMVVENLPVDLPTDNFSSAIARIVALSHKPDVMYIWFNGESGYAFQQQLRQSGIGPDKGTVLVTRHTALDSTTFWSRLPEGSFTVVQKIGPWTSTVGEIGNQFAADYRTFFDRWPESYAFEAYDSLRLIAYAIEQANSLAPEEIIQALESADVELASGRYYFPYGSQNDPEEAGAPLYMWHQWPDVPLLYLQYTEPNQPSSDMAVLWPEVYRTAQIPVFQPLSE